MPGNKNITSSIKDSLMKTDAQSFYNSCLSQPKLRTYVKITNFGNANIYLTKPLTFTQKAHVAKFKLGVLPLRLETGRFCRPKLPETDRICEQCNSNSIENEIHFALYCFKHYNIRKAFLNSIVIPSSIQTDYELINYLLYNNTTIKLFAQFIVDCYSNRIT